MLTASVKAFGGFRSRSGGFPQNVTCTISVHGLARLAGYEIEFTARNNLAARTLPRHFLSIDHNDHEFEHCLLGSLSRPHFVSPAVSGGSFEELLLDIARNDSVEKSSRLKLELEGWKHNLSEKITSEPFRRGDWFGRNRSRA